MKKFLFLLIAGFCTVQLSGQTINFSVQPLSGESELSAASQEMLQNKLRQIITRNSAGAANDYNVFVIEPVITVLDKQSTSGLMRNTTLVKGEFCSAYNRSGLHPFYPYCPAEDTGLLCR